MPVTYTVEPGDCLSSIALEYGFTWQSLWNDSANASLKQLRKDPNVLYPGDIVTIPDRAPKQYDAPAEQRHKFKLKGTPAKLRVRLLDAAGKARKNLPFKLKIDGRLSKGTTDSDGRVQTSIAPDAKLAVLTVTDSAGKILDLYELTLGGLNPVTEVSGLQQRLINLGFNCRPVDNEFGPITRAAMNAFQRSANLPATQDPDDATRDALVARHGS